LTTTLTGVPGSGQSTIINASGDYSMKHSLDNHPIAA